MLIYAAIAAIGLLFLLGMLLVGELFGGDQDHLGHHVDGDVGGPSIFSVKIMAAFVTAFGVGGVVARYYELSHPAASGIGVAAGIVMAGAVYQFAKVLYSQQASSELQMTQLVGRQAEVSIAIPANGVGQIAVSVAGERTEHLARSTDGRAVARGSEVTITALRGDSVVVTKGSGGTS